MANEYVLSYPRVAERGLVPVLSFIGLLLLIYVGLDAFSPPPEVTQYGGVPEASHGDVLRQICYLSVAVLIGLTALQRYSFDAIRILPFSMIVLLACVWRARYGRRKRPSCCAGRDWKWWWWFRCSWAWSCWGRSAPF